MLYTPNVEHPAAYRPLDVGIVVGLEGDYVIISFEHAHGHISKILSSAISFIPGSYEERREMVRARVLPEVKQHSEKRASRQVWGQKTNVAFEHSPLDLINSFLAVPQHHPPAESPPADAAAVAAYAKDAEAARPAADVVAAYTRHEAYGSV